MSREPSRSVRAFRHALEGKRMFCTFGLKGRLFLREGRTAWALPLMGKALADAAGKAPEEYTDMQKKTAEERKAVSSK